TAGTRFACRSHFPLGFGRQPPTSPSAVRVRFIPIDVDDRDPFLQIVPFIEFASQPSAVRLSTPVDRMLSAGTLLPIPPSSHPHPPPVVAAVLDKGRKLAIRYRRL